MNLRLFARTLLSVILMITAQSVFSQAKGTSAPDFAFPQKVTKQAEESLEKALRSGNGKQTVRSLIDLALAQSAIGQDKLPAVVKRIREIAADEKSPDTKALLNILLARIYYETYSRDEYKYNNRSLPLSPLPDDWTEWSGEQFRSVIENHCIESLTDKQALQSAALNGYTDIIKADKQTLVYYPTLYDFIASQAIDIRSNLSEFGNCLSIILLSRFETYVLQPRYVANNSNVKAILDIYADLLRFHADDTAPLINTDINRIEFVCNNIYNMQSDAANTRKNELLLNLYNEYRNRTEYSGDALCAMSMDNDKEYYSMISGFISEYPSYWRNQCLKNKLFSMSRPQLSCTIPSGGAPGRPIDVSITASNVNRCILKLYKVTDSKINPTSSRVAFRDVNTTPVQTLEIDIPGQIPFEYNITKNITLPAYGCYIVSLTTSGENPELNRYFDIIRCTDLASATSQSDHPAIIVFNPVSGQPVADASLSYYSGRPQQKTTIGKTDSNGFLSCPASLIGYHEMYPSKGADKYGFNSSLNNRKNEPDKIIISNNSYCDLPVYHPGDSVRWTGIIYGYSKDFRRPITGQIIRAVLRNANYVAIDTIEATTDSYGRIEGVFSIPKGELTGNYSISYLAVNYDKNAYSQGLSPLNFMVSDYKLPTFKVILSNIVNDSPSKGAVSLHGKIETYSGMGLGDIELKLNLSVRPNSMWGASNSVDFYSGTAATHPDGSFVINVPAEVFDNSPMPDGRYSAEITATSASGESRNVVKDFTRGPAYMINAYINHSRSAIDASLPVSAEITVLDGLMKPVELPLTLNIKGKNDSIIARIPVNPADTLLTLTTIPSGVYDFEFVLADTSLKALPRTLTDMVIYRLSDKTSPVKSPVWVALNHCTLTIAPKGKTKLTYAVYDDDTYILFTMSSDDKIIEQRWLTADAGVHQLEVSVPDGIINANASLFACRNHNTAIGSVALQRAEPEQELRIVCESFRNRLTPGDEETWTFRTVDSKGNPRESAIILGMYNSALNAIVDNSWNISFHRPYSKLYSLYTSYQIGSNIYESANIKWNASYGDCPALIIPKFNTYGRSFYQIFIRGMRNAMLMKTSSVETADLMAAAPVEAAGSSTAGAMMEESAAESDASYEMADLDAGSKSPERAAQSGDEFSYRDSNVTSAFFCPSLATDREGRLTFSFRVPNANTTWKFQAMAYTDRLSSASMIREVLANKPVMVTPNLPRFMRYGDSMTIEALVLNNSEDSRRVTTAIEIFNPATGEILCSADTAAIIKAGATSTAAIEFTAPTSGTAVGYRVKSSSDRFADGEQALIPLLASSAPVIETIPFYISPDSASFAIKLPVFSSDAAVNLQYCDNPVWYAVTALPGLRSAKISTPTDAASAIFSAAVAEGILRQNPIIEEVLREWTSGDRSDSTLVSMLERNSDLKTMLLQATPWVADAMSDTERMERLALLFDKKEINNLYSSAISTLSKLQRNGGGWAWIDMCPDASEWATANALYILGYLNRLGYMPDNKRLNTMITEALNWHQAQTEKTYRRYPKASYYGFLQLRDLWLSHSLSLTGKEIISKEIQKIVKNWKSFDIRNKACSAVLLYHNGYKSLSKTLLASIREYAETSPTKGMWWPSVGDVYGGQLLQLGIAADALLAIHEIEPQSNDIDKIRQWLILQKEAQNWGSGSLPSQIITAILTTSPAWIERAGKACVKINGDPLDVPYTDSALGYFRSNISGLAPSGATLAIEKSELSPAWGAVFARSTKVMADVEASSCEAVSIEKRIFRLNGSKWETSESLKVGDRVKIQLLIHAGRDMQYMAIDDDRAACLEPVEQLPQPIYSEGICFYRENRDASTNMFVANMPKGTYLLEYELWVNNAGTFSSGIATIQSQYAPELSAHSSGTMISVGK